MWIKGVKTVSKASKITVTQFFLLLFLSRIMVNITYNPYLNGSGKMFDHILSCLVSFAITFIIFIPTYILYKRYPTLSILEEANSLLGKLGIVVAAIFALYFLLISSYALSIYTMFMKNVIMPQTSVFVVCIAVVVVSLYAALKGIEGLARAGMLILVLSLAALIFLILALIPSVDTLNYTPLLYDGNNQFLDGINIMLSRTSAVALIAIFIPFIKKGSLKAGFISWNIGVYSLMALLILVIVGSQGNFLEAHIFPIYAAFNDVSVGFWGRLDIFYLGIWTSGLFIRISLNLLAIALCATKIFGDKAFKIAAVLGAALVAAAGISVSIFGGLEVFDADNTTVLFATAFVSVVLPILILIVDSIKGRSGKLE